MTLPHPTNQQPQLTPREIEISLMWIYSESKRAVALHLDLAEATVRAHIANVRQKYVAVHRPAGTKSELLLRLIEDGHYKMGVDSFAGENRTASTPLTQR